jgi:Flp pilus assembly protein TadG
MSLTKRFAKSLKSFAASQNGSMSVIFALSALPLFAAVGAAVDFSRYTAIQADVQSALDAASLQGAAVFGATEAKRQEIAEAAFQSNLGKGLAADVTFTAKDGLLKGEAEVAVPTSFMQLVGINSMTVTAQNQVNLINKKKAEIALVLDYSGSMTETVSGGVKYDVMRKATIKLMDELEAQEKGKFKVGLVPFSHKVYVTLPKAFVKGQNGTGSWTGCTVDRQGPYNTTNATPNPSNDSTKWGQAAATSAQDGDAEVLRWINDQNSYDCDGFKKNNLKVRPLSTDLAGAKAQLNQMKPYAYTHIPLGVEFGYQMLTPHGALGGDVAEFADTNVEKYLVILTDGKQTTPAYRGEENNLGRASTNQGEANLEALCANAKSDGVKIITMAFDLQGRGDKEEQDIKAKLKGCASQADYYFDAKDGGDLNKAFKKITTEIAQNIFLSK